jgi:uncharacterized protein
MILMIVLCSAAFAAGFIDAVVGGGGLIQVPVLLISFPGLTHVQIIATNRLASIAGTLVAAYNYVQKVKVEWQIVIIAGIAAALSSIIGTFAMGMVKPEIFKPILLVIIVILTVYSALNTAFGTKDEKEIPKPKFQWIILCIGLICGFYNGFIGPGTGTLLVFCFVTLAGMSMLKGTASTKIVNAIADGASLISFILQKNVIFKIAIPMMFCNMAGGYVGSKMAIKQGNSFIKKLFLFVMILLIIRMIYDIFMK